MLTYFSSWFNIQDIDLQHELNKLNRKVKWTNFVQKALIAEIASKLLVWKWPVIGIDESDYW